MTPSRMRPVAAVTIGATLLTSAPVFAQSAVHYYPGKDVVLVSVVESTSVTTTVEDNGTAFTLSRKQTTKREGTVALKTIADVAQGRTIDLQTSGLSDTSFAVELTEQGLLKNINLASTGRVGDILTSVAKFAGTVFAVAGLASGTRTTTCDGHAADFAALPKNGRFFIEQSSAGCTLAKQVITDQKTADQRETDLRTLEDQVPGTPAGEVAALQRRITMARAALEGALKTLAARSQAFAVALTEFEKEQELGTVAKGAVTKTAVLQVTDLPPLETVTDGMTVQQVEAALAQHKAAKEVFDRMRIAVTVESYAAPTSPTGGSGTSSGKTVEICSRGSRPLQMRVLLFKADTGAAAAIREISRSVEDIVHPAIPMVCQGFKSSAFADRKLAIAFDGKGRPQKIERAAKSDVAAVMAGVAAASTTFLSQASESLKSVEAIQASRRNISLDDLTTRAEELKRQKAVLDAQLQLQGAKATFESALSQQKLQADLNELNAEIQLASAEDSREVKAELDRLKLTLEQMQKTIELVKAEQELAKLRK